MKYEPTPDATPTIRGYDRPIVAEVIRAESKRIRSTVLSVKRRVQTAGGQRQLELAQRLWKLACEIEP